MSDIEKAIKGIECCRRGFCFACPYNDGVDDNVDCKQILADDALELLKSYQPRVLTLEEATGEDECWFEAKHGQFCGYADCIMMFDGTAHLWRCFASKPSILDCATYGKEWRCWSARPTDEQREAVKWE